jgi:hypothetical protein
LSSFSITTTPVDATGRIFRMAHIFSGIKKQEI